MGDIADYQFDNELMALILHQNDDCDMWCPYCYEEMSDEEKREFNHSHP